MSTAPVIPGASNHALARARERFNFAPDDVLTIAGFCHARSAEALPCGIGREAHRLEHRGVVLVAIYDRPDATVVTLLADTAIDADGRLKVKRTKALRGRARLGRCKAAGNGTSA